MMPKFAANLSTLFTEYPFLERFSAAADVGFKAVEYLFPYEFPPSTIARHLTQNGLTQALFNFPAGNWEAGDRGLAALPQRKREFHSSIAIAMEYAAVTHVKRLHVMSGLARSDDAEAARSYRENVAYAADSCARHGVDVLIEPINGRDMPGYFLGNFQAAASLIRELGRPNLKLQFDIYHRQILHGDVLTALVEFFPIIGHIQIASVPNRNEPNTGELNDDHILAELDRLGYSGYVGCEYRPAGRTAEGLKWIRRWAQDG
jgi:2-dehydrotetronate isomerase